MRAHGKQQHGKQVPVASTGAVSRAEEDQTVLIERRAEPSDPIVMSDIIVSSLLSELNGPGGVKPQRIGIRNVLRLIHAYQNEAFDVPDHVGILEQDDFDDLSAYATSDRPSRLFAALKATHEQFAPGSPTDDFARAASRAISKLSDDARTPEDLSEAKRLLEILSSAIHSA